VRDRKVTQRDPAGRLMSTFEEEEDDEMRDALPTHDLTLDELQQDHQQRMSREYQAYDNSARPLRSAPFRRGVPLSRLPRRMSAFGGKADIAPASQNVCL
jgi:hypothetical protein